MSQLLVKLPYFDFLLKEFEAGNVDVEAVFGRHVHWGYWENPKFAKGTPEDFALAADKLSQITYEPAAIANGMRVLDVGCGFGGTIACMNEQFSHVDLVGLNIDDRQLQRARKKVLPLNGNKIEFVCGNACELPFPDNSFDVVLAVECIFHFPDRNSFFKEAFRVLRPGGRLALSDFLSPEKASSFPRSLSSLLANFVALFYGKFNGFTMEDYRNLANSTGFKNICEKDITAESMPTYKVLSSLFAKSRKFNPVPYLATRVVEIAQRSGNMIYEVLAYEKQ